MQSRLLLNVVVSQGAAIFKLLTRKDQALLVRRNAFLVLDLLLDVLDRIRAVHIESDSLACQRLNKDLHGHRFEFEKCVFVLVGLKK